MQPVEPDKKIEVGSRFFDVETGDEMQVVKVDDLLARNEQIKKRGGKKPIPNLGFCQVYEAADDVFDRSSKLAVRVFFAMARSMDEKSGQLIYRVTWLAELLDVKYTTSVSGAIADLIERGHIRRIGRGHVVLNPEIVWRGTAGDRTVALWRWLNGLDSER